MDKKSQGALPSNNQALITAQPQPQPQPQHQPQTQKNWKTFVCSRCDGAVYFLEKWVVKPKLCQRCRLRDLGNLRSIFEKYLQLETEICFKLMPPRERQIAARKGPLLEKVRSAINNCQK